MKEMTTKNRERERKITSNNRDVHVPVPIDKNVDSVLECLVVQQQSRYVLKHYSWKIQKYFNFSPRPINFATLFPKLYTSKIITPVLPKVTCNKNFQNNKFRNGY